MSVDRIVSVWNQLYSEKGNPNVLQSAITESESALIYGIIRAEMPNNVLEIGTGYGFATAHISEALKDSKGGHLITIDPDFMNASDYAKDFINRLRLNDWVTFVADYSPNCLSKIIGTHPKLNLMFNYTIDIAFIDGDHSIEGTVADYNEIIKYMTPGGKIIIHDTKAHTGPANILLQVAKNGNKVMPFDTERGLAVIKVGII